MILKRIRPLILMVLMLLAMSSGCATSKPKASNDDQLKSRMDVASAALADNDPIGALQALAEAEKINPDLPEIYFLRTRAFHQKQDFARALVSIKKFIELEPKSSDGQLTLGIILMELGKPQEALTPLTNAANDPLYERAS